MAKLNTKLFCTYCGLPAQCLDHVIPVSHTNKKRKPSDYTMSNAVNVVPACNDCNSSLSNFWYHAIASRAGYLAERIAVRHINLLDTPTWSEDEIAELSDNLKKIVKAKQKEKALLLDRIRHCKLIAMLSDLQPLDVYDLIQEHGTILDYLASDKSQS
jgi:hypothetical protein